MLIHLKNFHRFLTSQSFYPIVLSTLLALGFFMGRALYARNWHFSGLVWNLFLAWVPYGFSIMAASLNRLFPRHAWLLLGPGALWLIFFPNAPYIVTDFLHLLELPPVPFWYDIGLLATFAWTGCFLAIASLRTMQYLVSSYLGRWMSWFFAAIVLVLGGLGIYLGRFGRWNSWDLFFQPFDIVKDILVRLINPFDNLRFFGFTMMFTAFLFVLYMTFASMKPADEMGK
ncbi:MAG: DUF1361 domain-containing protein [Chloroflexota bacterium]|nr:MAG: DUF1361 domain-containing protein [Chloroflexota bacterium]